jgi:hypothetical protein
MGRGGGTYRKELLLFFLLASLSRLLFSPFPLLRCDAALLLPPSPEPEAEVP